MESFETVLSSKLLWCTLICSSIYFYLKFVVYNYWRWQKIPHDEPSVPFGNLPLAYFYKNYPHGEIFRKSYEKFKDYPFYGLYLLHEPILVVNDPELIRLMFVKNFDNFVNRGSLSDESKDPLSCSLPRLRDEKWKRLRRKLSPTFTSGKLKQMYPLLEEICQEMMVCLDSAIQTSKIVEMKEIVSRFTIDCISSIAFGFNCNSLRDPDNEFHRYGSISSDFGKLFVLLSFYIPSLIRFLPVPEKRKKVQHFFTGLFKKMVECRKNGRVTRNDFLNLLMQLMDHGRILENEGVDPGIKETDSEKFSDDSKLSMMEAVAQAVIFFSAGQETTASAISCCLFELATHQEIQEKLRQELTEAFDSPEGLKYEKIFEMKYLDMVLCETLRKHPGAPVLNRICKKDFDIPGSNFRISKGLRIIIPINGIHMDPIMFPDPEKFDPTRFLPEKRAERHPFSYLPFGEGPRHCIGKRLGVLKPKIALCYLLKNFKFFTCELTPTRISYLNKSFVQVPSEKIYLQVEKIGHPT
ncbi:hypothetical protein QAD02_018589 [Eretmocerus hayati]|uniref:Uncharacterized protein n=1 Tax=Eretmocerus hayati TaxID=131215 RepID=A0ACC2PK59_9HYME|nr:hypothetical protein QAD02_018589 [Eretmocerus hayati]